MSKLRFTLVFALIGLFIILGAFLRLMYFDLMEFKADEVGALLITKYWLARGLPQFGLVSGAGINNPPGFIYLLLPVIVLNSSPLLVGLYITIFNIVALWFIYRLGVELFSPRAGLWACGFMAVHPWLILYSRKIWAQSLLPFFVLLFLIVIAHCTRCPRTRMILWAAPLVSLIWQIHYSGYCVLFFFIIWFVVQAVRKRIGWTAFLVGLLIGLILLLPYIHYLTRTDFADIRYSLRHRGRERAGCLEHLVRVIRVWRDTSFAGGFGYPFAFKIIPLSWTTLGRERGWLPLMVDIGNVLMLVLVISGIGFGCLKKTSASPVAHFTPWLVLFAALPIILYLIKGIRPPAHYFIVSFPAVLMLAGLGVDGWGAYLKGKLAGGKILFFLPTGAGAYIIVCGTVLWLAFILVISQMGGTGGDYGIAFRVQESVAQRLREEKIDPQIIDARLTRDNSIGIFYLLEERLKVKGPYADKKARLIDQLLFPGWSCFSNEVEAGRKDKEPLVICVSPLK